MFNEFLIGGIAGVISRSAVAQTDERTQYKMTAPESVPAPAFQSAATTPTTPGT